MILKIKEHECRWNLFSMSTEPKEIDAIIFRLKPRLTYLPPRCSPPQSAFPWPPHLLFSSPLPPNLPPNISKC